MARKLKSDRVLFITTVLLVFLGVVMVYSASAMLAHTRYNDDYLFLRKQIMWAALGLGSLALVMRVELYDADGSRMARWRAPGRISVASDPPGATVTAARYERDGDGRLRLVDERTIGAAPTAVEELAPGSYLFTLSAAGRAFVRYPVLLRRGEELRPTVSLPPEELAPRDFVYVPAGRFLYGSADDEDLRSAFFTAPPMHEVETGAFWIARHETTYGEWIAFLDSQDPEERARRSGAQPGVSPSASILTRGEDGRWQLEVRRADRVLVARAGELLRYPGRREREAQDWLKMPVAGITWDDARVYIEWLARTGRVPNARFCTEVEWERAARGADGRRFPTGDDIGPGEANYDATYGRDPAAMGADVVGSYPASSSPFGVDDMTGNVWEWVVPAGDPSLRIARGGSYLFSLVAGRLVNRTSLDASYRDGTLGLRVCASPQVGIVSDK
jgi:formylglycine-generating enzyme required for sulfatase activity